MIKNIICLAVMLILTGCATNATGPMFSQAQDAPSNMGTLYVAKSEAPFMTPLTVVEINDKPFVSLAGKGYSYVYLAPGVYRLSFVGATTVLFMTEIEIKAGQNLFEYYNGFNFSVAELSPYQAPDYLKDFHYVTPMNTSFKLEG